MVFLMLPMKKFAQLLDLEMVKGYPLRKPAIPWRISASASGYGFGFGCAPFPDIYAGIRIS
jgi:hypothetical protein